MVTLRAISCYAFMVFSSENKGNPYSHLNTFLFWLPMVFIGMANGIFRQLVLLNFLGELSARQMSSILLVILLSLYVWLVYPRLRITSTRNAFQVGCTWMFLTFIFETLLGYFISHLSVQQIFSEYNVLEGKFWPLVLLALLFLPVMFRVYYRENIGEENSVKTRSTRYTLCAILLIVSVNALGGAYYGMDGARDVPLEWLEGSPFENYFVPSFFLFVFIGVISFGAVINIFRQKRFVMTSYLSGGMLVAWIVIQVALIGFVSWLQPAMFFIGIVILVLTEKIRRASVA